MAHSGGNDPHDSPAKIVYVGMAGAIISLFMGLLVGIPALAFNSGFPTIQSLANGIIFHPDMMVFGVLGGLLITEKLELMEKFRIMGRYRISRITILSLFSGVYIASAGIILEQGMMRDMGLILILIASLLFLHYMTSRRNPGMKEIKYMSGASIFVISLSSIANMNHIITYNTQFAFLVLLFPVIYVLAERVELGFVRGMSSGIIRSQTVIGWTAVILAFLSVETEGFPFSMPLLASSITLLLIMAITSIIFDPNFRKRMKKSHFQTFMKTGILISYFWLLSGIILFITQIVYGHGYLDPAAHSIALGFIGTFIISHSPIIFPLTLKKKAIQENVTLLPIFVITLANVMRVFGDLTVPFYEFSAAISYYSGYVILIAILAFLYNLKRIMGKPKKNVMTQ